MRRQNSVNVGCGVRRAGATGGGRDGRLDALKQQTDADFAVHPVMNEFYEVFRQSDIRRFDVFAALPFKRNAVIASFPGTRIQELAKAPDNVMSGDVRTIDPLGTYRVAMEDVTTEAAYHLSKGSVEQTGKDIRDLLMEYIRKLQ